MLIIKSGTQHLEDYISVKYLSISKICDFLKSVFCGHYKNNQTTIVRLALVFDENREKPLSDRRKNGLENGLL